MFYQFIDHNNKIYRFDWLLYCIQANGIIINITTWSILYESGMKHKLSKLIPVTGTKLQLIRIM